MDCSLPGSSVHGISQARYWSGLPFPSPGDPPNSVIEPMSLALAGGLFTIEPPGKPFWTLFHGCFSSSHIDLLASLYSLFGRLFSQMFEAPRCFVEFAEISPLPLSRLWPFSPILCLNSFTLIYFFGFLKCICLPIMRDLTGGNMYLRK